MRSAFGGLRFIAAILLLCCLLAIFTVAQTGLVHVTSIRHVWRFTGLQAMAVPILLAGACLIALVASSPRRSESTRLRMSAGLLLLVGLGMFVLGHAIETAA